MLAVRNSTRMMPAPRRNDPIGLIREELDQLFNRFFSGFPTPVEQLYGKLDGEWKDTDTDITVRLDAPGFEPTDFEIQVSGEVLMVRAERKEEGEGTVHRRLERSMTLPAPVVPEKVEALYRNGVLELKMPKAEVAKWQKIAVKTA